MAFKPDFRKELRATGNAIQDDNARRLISGQTVSGGSVAPRKAAREKPTGRARRVRVLGARLSTKDLQGSPGVDTGAMLRDMTKRGNVKVGRTSVKITPSPDQILKVRTFIAGNKKTGQPPRPVSGIDDARMKTTTDTIAKSGRDQFVANLNKRRKG